MSEKDTRYDAALDYLFGVQYIPSNPYPDPNPPQEFQALEGVFIELGILRTLHVVTNVDAVREALQVIITEIKEYLAVLEQEHGVNIAGLRVKAVILGQESELHNQELKDIEAEVDIAAKTIKQLLRSLDMPAGGYNPQLSELQGDVGHKIHQLAERIHRYRPHHSDHIYLKDN